MEYCGGGDLGGVIKELIRKKEYAKEEFVWRILSQLVTALYRCHYGVDPPEPGSDFTRQKDTRTSFKGNEPMMMILHRDLKPENVFLGEDQSVKLGDFGLSKLMQSHDFASTYVGTPFYMSPEICAAEKYTLHSDIWSVGCIIYELCTKKPPFNAHSHLQLMQRIRKGEFEPLPNIYSQDLQNVVASCLKVNPLHRPDTASLLSIPYIWIARRQQEMVSIGKALKTREEIAEVKLQRAEERLSALEADKAAMRAEIEGQLRREWEVKARLEIDRQVQRELERLRKKFDKEVDEKVTSIVLKQQQRSTESRALRELSNPPVAFNNKENTISYSSSINTADEDDFPSTTDLTDLSQLSLDSPVLTTSVNKALPSKKSKTPFARARTGFDSPADIQMSEPSPISISSLALSPRRTAAAQATANAIVSSANAKNIFTDAQRQKTKWEPKLPGSSDEYDEHAFEHEDFEDDDDIPELPSPTRTKMHTTDPFKPLPHDAHVPTHHMYVCMHSEALPVYFRIASINLLLVKPMNWDWNRLVLNLGLLGRLSDTFLLSFPSRSITMYCRNDHQPQECHNAVDQPAFRLDRAEHQTKHATATATFYPLVSLRIDNPVMSDHNKRNDNKCVLYAEAVYMALQ